MYLETVNTGVKKLLVAYEQHTEDILREMWMSSQSPLSYDKWKNKATKKNSIRQQRRNGKIGKAVITGPDLSQM